MTLRLKTPLGEADARKLRAGDSVLLTGVIYTARDAAHKRLCELVEAGKPLPFDPMDAVVYYVGPTPAAPGQIIGSAGPTTSYRMDAYAPTLIALGLRGMIGKGRRNAAVIASMKQHCSASASKKRRSSHMRTSAQRRFGAWRSRTSRSP